MRCSICGIRIDSVDEAVEGGWAPYFYEGETEHEFACPDCEGTFLQEGEHGEWEVKEEYKGKITFLDEEKDHKPGEHLMTGIAVLENEERRLN
jgi:hypothetical protein